jgi:hypothetical protein
VREKNDMNDYKERTKMHFSGIAQLGQPGTHGDPDSTSLIQPRGFSFCF